MGNSSRMGTISGMGTSSRIGTSNEIWPSNRMEISSGSLSGTSNEMEVGPVKCGPLGEVGSLVELFKLN